MRAEIKIGILVCLALAFVIALYFGLTDEPAAGPMLADEPQPGETPQRPETVIVKVAPPQAAETPAAQAATRPSPEPAPATRPAAKDVAVRLAPATPPPPAPVATELKAPTPPAASAGTYTVVKGDKGFWTIAKKVYGDGKYWHYIAKANPGVDPQKLRPGQKVIVPPAPTGTTRPSLGERVVSGSDGKPRFD